MSERIVYQYEVRVHGVEKPLIILGTEAYGNDQGFMGIYMNGEPQFLTTEICTILNKGAWNGNG